MLHGDISNHSAPIIAFNVDSLLHSSNEQSQTKVQRFLNRFVSEKQLIFNRPVNKTFSDTLNRVWALDYSIYLVTYSPYQQEITDELYRLDLPYTRLETVSEESIDDFRLRVRFNFQSYVDDDQRTSARIGSNNMFTLSELRSVLH
jgi:hypothetical protein